MDQSHDRRIQNLLLFCKDPKTIPEESRHALIEILKKYDSDDMIKYLIFKFKYVNLFNTITCPDFSDDKKHRRQKRRSSLYSEPISSSVKVLQNININFLELSEESLEKYEILLKNKWLRDRISYIRRQKFVGWLKKINTSFKVHGNNIVLWDSSDREKIPEIFKFFITLKQRYYLNIPNSRFTRKTICDVCFEEIKEKYVPTYVCKICAFNFDICESCLKTFTRFNKEKEERNWDNCPSHQSSRWKFTRYIGYESCICCTRYFDSHDSTYYEATIKAEIPHIENEKRQTEFHFCAYCFRNHFNEITTL